MSDDTTTQAAPPYGWSGTTATGQTAFYKGGVPTSIINVTAYGTLADYEAAVAAARVPATTPASLANYAATSLAAILAAGQTFNVAASGATSLEVLCDGTSATRADLAMLYDFGQENPTGTKTWVDNNGVPTVLTGTEFIALGEQTGTWIDAGYETLGTVLTAIASTPPAITTTAQIDAAFAAL